MAELGDLKQGDSLPELRVTPDKYLPHRYAGASGDFNPIHIDPEFAKAVGLPSNILHGLYSMAEVARGAGSGIDVEMDVFWAFETEGGKLRRMHLYASRARALEAIEGWSEERQAGGAA